MPSASFQRVGSGRAPVRLSVRGRFQRALSAPAAAPPTVTSAEASLLPGAEAEVPVRGTGLLEGVLVEMGEGVTVLSADFLGPTELRAHVLVAPDAPPGRRPVVVTSPDGLVGALLQGPEVLPLPVATPAVSDVSPAPGTPILRTTPLTFRVADADADMARVLAWVAFADAGGRPVGSPELALDGAGFTPLYAALSTRTPTAGGFAFSLLRTGGWPGAPTLSVLATDAGGRENS